jgi:uncharacterized membrane protein YeaQ/YmgE (transglycosylase-associated protein family)
MHIIAAIIGGFIIGLLARLIMPGKQNIGLIMTTVLGIVGGLIGSWVAGLFHYGNANGGFEWIPFFIGIVAAIVLIAIYLAVRGRSTTARKT